MTSVDLVNASRAKLSANQGAAVIRPQGLVGPSGPGGSDSGVAGYIADSASLSRAAANAAIDARITGKVDKGALSFNVKDYGAVGNGTTDDTTAVNAALTAAVGQSTASNIYGDARSAVVFFPPGTYKLTSTITITEGVTLAGDNQRSTGLLLGNGTNADMFQVNTGVVGFEMRNLTLDGNKANNTSGKGIYLLPNTVYDGGGKYQNVTLRNFAGHNFHMGLFRSNGRMFGVTSGGSGADGIRMEGYDWQISMGDCGSNAGSGLRLENGGNLTVVGAQYYGNLNGIYIGNGADRSIWTGIVCESNNADNVYINSGTQSRTHSFHGSFGVPLGATNLFSHFKIDSARVVEIAGHVYDATGAGSPTVPKYIVDNTTGSGCQVEVGGLTWQNDDYGTAFAAVNNNLTMGGKGMSVKIPAHQLVPISGGCALTSVAGNGVVLSMPAGADSIASAFLASEDLPRKWKTIDIYAHSTNLGAGTTGTYKLLLATFKHANGEDYTSVSATGSAQTITPSAQNLRKDTLLVSQEGAVDWTHDFEMKLTRQGATDGFANAVGIKCLEIRWRT